MHEVSQILGLAAETTCSWWPADADELDGSIFETTCQRTFEFTVDGIQENGFAFCPFCGGRIEEPRRG
jgi:hypothetical protein